MPICGQSWTRPVASFSFACCQRNAPVSASKHTRQLASDPRGNRSPYDAPLFVPIKTLPWAMTGLLYTAVPSLAVHLTFSPVSRFQVVGRFVSFDTLFRCGPPPYCGQSRVARETSIPLRSSAVPVAARLNTKPPPGNSKRSHQACNEPAVPWCACAGHIVRLHDVFEPAGGDVHRTNARLSEQRL